MVNKNKPVTMEEVNRLHDEWWNSLTDKQKQQLFEDSKLQDLKGACEDWKSAEGIGSNKATDLLKKYCINI